MLYYIGYFSILVVLMIVSIVVAKKHSPWTWFVLGAGLYFIAMFGNTSEGVLNNNTTGVAVNWIIYAVILIVTLIILFLRINSKKKKTEADDDTSDNNLN